MSNDTAAVTLRLFGPLRTVVGRNQVHVCCAGGTVRESLARFAEDYGDAVRPFIFDEQGNQRLSLILLLNGEPVRESDQVRVSAGDEIGVLLPLAGG